MLRLSNLAGRKRKGRHIVAEMTVVKRYGLSKYPVENLVVYPIRERFKRVHLVPLLDTLACLLVEVKRLIIISGLEGVAAMKSRLENLLNSTLAEYLLLLL